MPVGSRRYSSFLRPALNIIDLFIILILAKFYLDGVDNQLRLYIYIIASWLFTTFALGFYEVYRFTPLVKILYLLAKQITIFAVVSFAYFGIFKANDIDPKQILKYILVSFSLISLIKLGVFNFLKKYRTIIGGNFRNVIILGKNSKTLQLQNFFENNPAYGYKLLNLFDFRKNNISINEIIAYIESQHIDEIYCSITELNNSQITEIINYADNNLKIVKFLPDTRDIYTRRLNYEYYGYTPILSLRTLPIEKRLNLFLKRVLDIALSLLVIFGLLSWMTPLLAIFIKLDSKGSVFFKQKRKGLDYKEFNCYKFRSMYMNDQADIDQAIKNDVRITRIGKFLRRTSIDELPQFVNVLFGQMSTVGPRPLMVSVADQYAERIDKFMVRHFVKPGITGLAQVSGYRGEVETENDIKNRVRFDIFYLENWSILMDLRIIAKTIINLLIGDKKAY